MKVSEDIINYLQPHNNKLVHSINVDIYNFQNSISDIRTMDRNKLIETLKNYAHHYLQFKKVDYKEIVELDIENVGAGRNELIIKFV